MVAGPLPPDIVLDTIRLRIPLTRSQWTWIHSKTLDDLADRWIPSFYNQRSGEIKMRRLQGLAVLTTQSHDRDLRWDVEPTWREGDTWLTVEVSVPKLPAGHGP